MNRTETVASTLVEKSGQTPAAAQSEDTFVCLKAEKAYLIARLGSSLSVAYRHRGAKDA